MFSNALTKTFICLCYLVVASAFLYTGSSQAAGTYYTDDDNEDNGGNGTPDNDLDVTVLFSDAIYPIEFNIDTLADSPTTSAKLLINANDVDEESGEALSVSINGFNLGTLAGVDGQDTTTIFDVPTAQLNPNNNLIEVSYSDPWDATISWGQLIIDDGPVNPSEALSIKVNTVNESNGTLTLGIGTQVTTTNNGVYRIELNLRSPNGDMIDTETADFTGETAQTQAINQSLSYQISEATGIFVIEAHIFYLDNGFYLHHDHTPQDMSHVQDYGPDQLPAHESFSTLSSSEASITANSIDTAVITLQGVDVASNPINITNQTVTFSSNAGSFGPTSDNGDGTYSATYTSSTTAGNVTISAILDGELVTNTTTIQLLPGPPAITTSNLSIDTNSVPANGSDASIVTARLSDVFGNNLISGGDNIGFITTLGTVGDVTDHGDGTYSAPVTSTFSGNATISGTIDGSNISDTVEVIFTPLPASPDTTQVTSTPGTISATGTSTSTIIVEARNILDQALDIGGNIITLSASTGTLSDVVDLNNGRYSATYTSPTATGIAVITATLDGSPVLDTATVTLEAGTPIAENSTIISDEGSLVADGTTSTLITVRGQDVFGNSVERGGAHVSLNTSLGTLSPVNDLGDGRYTATLSTATETGSAIVSGTMNGVNIVDTAVVQFVAGPADPTTSTFTTSSTILTANGSDSATITVQTFDTFGNALEVGGDNINISSTSGSLSNVSDLGNGSYQATLSAPQSVGNTIVSATINGFALPNTLSIEFVPGVASVTNTQVSSSLNQLVADGSTQSLITIQAIDAFNNPLTEGGDNISLESTLGTINTITDLGNGQYQAILQSSFATGTAIISAFIDGDLVEDNAEVSMMSLPTANTVLSQTARPTLSGEFPQMIGASLTVTINDINYSPGDGNLFTQDSDWSLTIPEEHALADNEYDVIVRVTDIASQISSDITNNELLVDTISPTIFLDTLGSADNNNIIDFGISGICTVPADIITITITDENGNSITEENVACTQASSFQEGRFSSIINVRELDDGLLNIIASIEDRVGNNTSDSDSVTKNSCSPDNTLELCDTDEDGISNGDELRMGLDPFSYDSDGDGISDLNELNAETQELIDTDNDGTPDALDIDSDNDGLEDSEELGSNPDIPRDTDNDGTPDFQDIDSDNDHIPDIFENEHSNTDVDGDGILNHRDTDSDADGLPDGIENGIASLIDSDGDGIDNAFDVDNRGGLDENNDGIGDSIRLLDSDGDGHYNMYDQDSDNDGMDDGLEANVDPSQDIDGDGINDLYDTDSVGGLDTNSDGLIDSIFPPDTDGDGLEDYIDLDSDNDGLTDIAESGGIDSDPTDGLKDSQQEKTTTPIDSDNDGIPDHLDLESSDGTNDGNAPFDIAALGIDSSDAEDNGQLNSSTDQDNDGIADVVDEDPFNFGSPIDLDGDGVLNTQDLDNDNDGIPDIIEGDFTVDTDNDGQPDKIDLDSDNDGLSDIREANTGLVDFNSDGLIDSLVDSNDDGLDDSISTTFTLVDSDNDGIANHRDLDSDGDGVFDLHEANLPGADLSLIDADEDGMVDETGDFKGLTSHLFSAFVDTDEDGIENYLDIDSDNDGFEDGPENGDFNDNGVNDLAEDNESTLTTSRRGSGGAIDFSTIVMMSLLTIIFALLRQKSVAHIVPLALITVSLVSTSGLAEAHGNEKCARTIQDKENKSSSFQPCWYGSIGIGSSYVSPAGESNGWSTDDDSSIGASIHAGRHISRDWAAEISYLDLGEAGLGNSNPTLSASIDPSIKYRSPSIMLIYRFLNFNQSFNSYFKLGPTWMQTSASDSRIDFEEHSQLQAAWGLGMHYRISKSPWFVAIDYMNLAKDARFTSLQIGRYFGFNESEAKKSKKAAKIPYENLRLKLDSDQDGVIDQLDHCPLSIRGVEVDENGCCTQKSGCTRIQ